MFATAKKKIVELDEVRAFQEQKRINAALDTYFKNKGMNWLNGVNHLLLEYKRDKKFISNIIQQYSR